MGKGRFGSACTDRDGDSVAIGTAFRSGAARLRGCVQTLACRRVGIVAAGGRGDG